MKYAGMIGNRFAERRAWCKTVCACHRMASDPKKMMETIKSVSKARWALNILRIALGQLEEATGNEEATARLMTLYNLSKPEFRAAIGNLERAMPQLPENRSDESVALHEERSDHIGSELTRIEKIEINQRTRPFRSAFRLK